MCFGTRPVLCLCTPADGQVELVQIEGPAFYSLQSGLRVLSRPIRSCVRSGEAARSAPQPLASSRPCLHQGTSLGLSFLGCKVRVVTGPRDGGEGRMSPNGAALVTA